jgi:hypothetical protein
MVLWLKLDMILYIMATGALMQLVATDQQNTLVNGPNIVVGPSCVNMTLESGEYNHLVKRMGDILNACLVKVTIDDAELLPIITYANLIEYTELEIGGQTIEHHSDIINDILSKLYERPIINNNNIIYLPLNFFHCDSNNISNTIPLISLQFHSVVIKIRFKLTVVVRNCELLHDYGLLDTLDRRQMSRTMQYRNIIEYQICDSFINDATTVYEHIIYNKHNGVIYDLSNDDYYRIEPKSNDDFAIRRNKITKKDIQKLMINTDDFHVIRCYKTMLKCESGMCSKINLLTLVA